MALGMLAGSVWRPLPLLLSRRAAGTIPTATRSTDSAPESPVGATVPMVDAHRSPSDDRDPDAGAIIRWSTAVGHIDVAGVPRSYLTLRPLLSSSASLPMVIVLHGRRGSPGQIERLTGIQQVVGPAIFVFPAGYRHSWNAGGCCGTAHAAGINDIAFLSTLPQRVLAGLHDPAPHAVYLMGFSNGGRMAYEMACAHPRRWAGIAVVEAVPAASCPSPVAVPMVIIANRHDPFYSMSRPGKVVQGYVQQSMAASVEHWRRLEGCHGRPLALRLGNTTVERWDSCSGTATFTYAVYPQAGHFWPHTDGRSPGASRLIWSAWHDRSSRLATRHVKELTSPSL